MGLQKQNRMLLLSCGTLLCITSLLISCCFALPKPQSIDDEDDDYFANFAATRGAPLITPVSPDITLEVNSNYSLRCEADEPIVWHTTTPYEFLEFENTTFKTLNGATPYGSMLHLTNIKAENVGYYYCIKHSEFVAEGDYDKMVENFKAAKIYIFVNDPNTLLVPMIVPVISASQYDDVVIPCKPTMPDTVVELTTSDQMVHSSDKVGRYNPKLGFVVQIQQITEAGEYMCKPQTPSPLNEAEEVNFLILYSGNENNDRELAPICDVFPIDINNRNNTINCTVFASEVPLKLNNNNNNSILSSLSPVNNKIFISQSNINNNNNDVVVNPMAVVVSRKSRSNDIIPLSSSSPAPTLTTATSITKQKQSFVGGASSMVNNKTKNGGNMVNDGEAGIDNDDDDGDDDLEGGGGGVRESDSNNNLENVKLYETTTKQYDGVVKTSASPSPRFRVTTESSYGVRTGKRYTTTSYRREQSNRNNFSTRRPRTNSTIQTTHVPKPRIHSPFKGHAVEGETFNLTCAVEIQHGVGFRMDWKTPLDGSPRLTFTKASVNETNQGRVGESFLTVTDAQKSDNGYYKCIVIDHSNKTNESKYTMTILKKDESYINIREPNNHSEIIQKVGGTVNMNVEYRGYPTPSLNWYNPSHKHIIQSNDKYYINITDTSILLRIKNVSLYDSGEYVLKANNGVKEEELKFRVKINSKPEVSIEDIYVQAGQEARLSCRTHAYPKANVIWTYYRCDITPKWPSCRDSSPMTFNSSRSDEVSLIETINSLNFKPDYPGRMECKAENKLGTTVKNGYVLIGDITDKMSVYGVDENQQIAKGDEVIITCAALAYNYSANLDWYKDNQLITNGSGIEIRTNFSDYSYKKIIKFTSIEDEHGGSYECRVPVIDGELDTESKFLTIIVNEPSKPDIYDTNMGDIQTLALGESLELKCKSKAIPKASIIWYKDDEKLNDGDNISILEDNTILKIPFIKPGNEGQYRCVASNRMGVDELTSEVKISNMPGIKTGWIVGIVAFMLLLIVLVVYMGIRMFKERELMRQMKLAGLANFEEGALEQINPAMSLDEQADLLPYDRRFEFPRDKLKLGKKLGAGAFGVVLKGHAMGIIPEEKETVVAVKMVKRTADNEVIKALVSELKIMVHLGQHLNVVNLLGAVTKNIAKREVMVIVEYCRYGNVQNFLLRNRKRFVNQINSITDKIDPSIVEQRFSNTEFELNRNSENDPRSGTRAGRPNSSNYLRQSDLYEGHVDSCATEQTVMTTVPEGEDQILSNNSVQPAWRSNYKPDTNEAMTINTSDLVSWAFQVARGMDYLSSRKVLHGDLAARNILLCEDNVVKICDFGLARSMYKNDNYKKQGEAPLPIKWLALESLSDQVFSTYTDVWSFGIVLWEFFSLAKVPYPGMDANQTLYLKLKDGYRMEKPPFANDELYDIMLECWSANPESRPLFHELEKKFARLLGDEVTNHYVDLNEPYLKINTEHLQQSATDYLALMGSPDEMAPPPPRYVNGMILPEIRIDPSDDYLQMNSKTGSAIFSPRPIDDYVKADNFTFLEQHSPTISNNLDSPVTKNRKKFGVPPEEIPMLQKSSNGIGRNREGSQSDSDTEQTPNADTMGKTFAQITRRPTEIETSLTDTTDGSYVNVKAIDLSKKFMNSNGTKDAFSNPSYLMLKTVNEGRK